MNYLKPHKSYINEWKSVSDDVKTLVEYIANLMWEKSQNDKPTLDSVLKIPFITGDFYLPMNNVFKDNQPHFGIDGLNIWYKLYFVDSEKEYNRLYSEFGNSEYEDKEKRVYIRGGLIRGDFNKGLVEDLYHELNHAFEYGMGMEKREELYNTVYKILTNTNSSIIESAMCRIIYYTFPHEQDAFTHQFYGYLKEHDFYLPFDDILPTFNPYVDFSRCVMIYTSYLNNNYEAVKKVLNEVGMDIEQFNKRYKFGDKRFEKKLRRVYQRYMYEQQRKRLNIEGVIKSDFATNNILEEYKKRYKDIKLEDYKDFIW